MRSSHASILVFPILIAHCLMWGQPAYSALVPLVTQDATQPFTSPSQDNFEQTLAGDQTSRFTGQFLNAFPTPNLVNVSFNPASNTTLVHFAGTPIAASPTAVWTFGFAINSISFAPGVQIVNPGILDGYWTPGPNNVPGHVPQQNMMAAYMPSSQQAFITIANDPFTFSLFSVGYLVTGVPFALTSLNRSVLPPAAFLPSGIPDGTTLTPGASISFGISGIAPGEFVTIFADSRFSGSSSSEPYKDLSGHWLEFQAGVPEPSSWLLLAIGATALVACGRIRRRAQSEFNLAGRLKTGGCSHFELACDLLAL
jgi:hypothetical protein